VVVPSPCGPERRKNSRSAEREHVQISSEKAGVEDIPFRLDSNLHHQVAIDMADGTCQMSVARKICIRGRRAVAVGDRAIFDRGRRLNAILDGTTMTAAFVDFGLGLAAGRRDWTLCRHA
jgi:hypothetical protein